MCGHPPIRIFSQFRYHPVSRNFDGKFTKLRVRMASVKTGVHCCPGTSRPAWLMMLSTCPEVSMKPTSAFRFLLLLVPVVWVFIRLLPAEHPQYGNLRPIGSQEHQSDQATTGSHKESSDRFVNHESSFRAHYQSHYATSGYDFNHYRLAYMYGVDLARDSDNRKMEWSGLEPHARQSWNEKLMGPWSQHRHAVLYGWEQGLKLYGD